MSTEQSPQPAPIAIGDDLTIGDLRLALSAGWRDFLAMPKFGLFFSSVFTLTGIALAYLTAAEAEAAWLITAAAGFPIIAPFTAVGLYEVSRRREAGLPMSWRAVLGALNGRGDGQILSIGVILFVAFGFWIIIAHAVFAIFMAESGIGGESLAVFATPAGLLMLITGSIIGGVIALVFYAMTVISLPMLVDRPVDFLTAIISSIQTFQRNKRVMLVWAGFIAITLLVAMLPLFLGLLVALPVLGHATWHLYRRVVSG